MNLDGKTVLVTGAAKGIGRAIAELLAQHGANIALVDISTDLLADVAATLQSRVEDTGNSPPLCIAADVAFRAQVDQMVTDVVAHFGAIDICFSNAGIIEVQGFLDLEEDSFDRIMAVNTKGVFLCGQAVARHMVKRGGGGCIINTGSVASRVGIADMAAYSASKAAVMSLTRSMALALAPHQINVNALAPGIVATDMWAQIDRERCALYGQKEGEPTRQRVEQIPLGRAAQVEDVAHLAAFLAGPSAQYITGQSFNIDGGSCPS